MDITNKIKDTLNIQRVLSEDEVKKERELINKKIAITALGIGCTGLVILKYSATVDTVAFTYIDDIKNYLSKGILFMGMPISNGQLLFFAFLIVLLVYAYAILMFSKTIKKGSKG